MFASFCLLTNNNKYGIFKIHVFYKESCNLVIHVSNNLQDRRKNMADMIEKWLKKCRETELQLEKKRGLSEKQIKLCCKEGFIPAQMAQIRLGFEHGLSFEDVLFYADPSVNKYVMNEIREGLEHGVKKKQLKILKEFSGLSGFEISFIRELIELGNGKSCAQLQIIKKDGFNRDQRMLVIQGFRCDMAFEDIKLYAQEQLSVEQMEQIRKGIINGLSRQQVCLYADKNVSSKVMKYMRIAMEAGIELTLQQAKEAVKKK